MVLPGEHSTLPGRVRPRSDAEHSDNSGQDVGEIKRLYVRPDARGARLGRRITRALLNRARKLGYDRVVLDTLPNMKAAIAIYRGMGFVPIRPYWAHPYPDALFFEYRPRGRAASSTIKQD